MHSSPSSRVSMPWASEEARAYRPAARLARNGSALPWISLSLTFGLWAMSTCWLDATPESRVARLSPQPLQPVQGESKPANPLVGSANSELAASSAAKDCPTIVVAPVVDSTSRWPVENPAQLPGRENDSEIIWDSAVESVAYFQEPAAQTEKPQDPQAVKKSLFDQLAESLELSEAEAAAQNLNAAPTQEPSENPVPIIQPVESRPLFGARSGVGSAVPAEAVPAPLQPLLPLKAADVGTAPSSETIRESVTDQPSGNTPPSQRATAVATKSDFAWENPSWLCSRLTYLTEFSTTREWAERVTEQLQGLGKVQAFSDPQAAEILRSLDLQIADSERVFERAVRHDEQVAASVLLRIRYDLIKSVTLWKSCVALGVAQESSTTQASDEQASPFRQASYRKPEAPVLDPQWEHYLLLDQFQKVIQDPQATENAKRKAARASLVRLTSPVLSEEQSAYLNRALPAEFVEYLAEMAIDDVQLPKLMKSFENYLATKSGVQAAWIAREFQNLSWHREPEAQALANEINTHLRNANFRISISDRWLNSLLPSEQETHEPVNERVLGADVRGQSQVANRLQLRFVPDNARVHLLFESIGRVMSNTEASRSGVTVHNRGNARFHAAKSLFIGKRGIETADAQARSTAQNRVVGIASNLDGFPILGNIARKIAEREIQAQEPLAKRHVEQRLESTVKQRFSQEVDSQLEQLQEYLTTNLIEPLTALDLEPTPMETRSTSDRMIMRYRLAGRDQLAASSARPAGLDNSLLSMQIHESVLNNLLNRMELNGNEFTVVGLRQHLGKMLGVKSEGDSDLEDALEATIEFAPYDPIRLSFDQDMVTVEFNLKSLQIGKGKVWKNITASANYIYELDGLKLTFKQDGQGVKVDGHRFNARDQIAVRSIFTKIFRNDYSINLLPQRIIDKVKEPMVVSQLDILDGWIGVSFDHEVPEEAAGSKTANLSSGILPIIRKR